MRRSWLLISLMALAPAAQADVDFSITPAQCFPNCQSDFEAVMDDIGASINYKQLAPAESTGVLGIGVGGFVNYTPVENKPEWKRLTGQNVDTIGMAGLSVDKGLPFGFDIGAFYSSVPSTSVDVYGGQVRYALLEGGIAEPALAVRGAYTKVDGIDDFDYDAWSADVSLSKGFAMLTPYVGGGYVWATAKPQGSTAQAAGLKRTESNQNHFFVGMRIALGLLEMTPEYERVGSNNGYNLRLGLSF